MTFKQVATSVKFWMVTVVAIMAGLTALGATVDRPAWKSELNETYQIAMQNAKDITQNEIDDVRRRIWDHEDRFNESPNADLARKIKELIEHIRRLEGKLQELRDEEG